MQTITFDEYEVSLPKGDLKEEWEILKSYMDIKLKNYKSDDIKSADEIVEEEKENFEKRMNIENNTEA